MGDCWQHLIVLWEWAHSEHSPSSLDGPTHNVHPGSLNQPMWVFPSPLVKLHMGFNDCYGINLPHYVVVGQVPMYLSLCKGTSCLV